MAEAIAPPLAIAGIQGAWFILEKFRHSRPKCRLQKWEGKVAKALERVDKLHSKINPSDVEKLMQRYTQYYFAPSQPLDSNIFFLRWEIAAEELRTELEEENTGAFKNWKTWTRGKQALEMAKGVEHLAKVRNCPDMRV